MGGLGVVQDGFPFTWAELDRGTPRFWWSGGRKRAYAAALAARAAQEGAGDRGLPRSEASSLGVPASVAHVARGGIETGAGPGQTEGSADAVAASGAGGTVRPHG